MQNELSMLMDSYQDFTYMVAEYNILNKKLKSHVKENHNKAIIDYYSLRLKIVDKSTYADELIPYLMDNNLKYFINKNIDNKKINEMVSEKILDRDYVISNIEFEKSVLDIKLRELPEKLENFKEQTISSVNNHSLIKVVQRRELLKTRIDESRYLYYKYAKELKDLMRQEGFSQYRFQYNDDIGLLKIRTTGRVYSKDFIGFIDETHNEAIKLSVDSKKLMKSKDKNIDRDYVDRHKKESFQEYLYVSIVRSALNRSLNKRN